MTKVKAKRDIPILKNGTTHLFTIPKDSEWGIEVAWNHYTLSSSDVKLTFVRDLKPEDYEILAQ